MCLARVISLGQQGEVPNTDTDTGIAFAEHVGATNIAQGRGSTIQTDLKQEARMPRAMTLRPGQDSTKPQQRKELVVARNRDTREDTQAPDTSNLMSAHGWPHSRVPTAQPRELPSPGLGAGYRTGRQVCQRQVEEGTLGTIREPHPKK